ncbi:LysR family transcriptional regulator [Phototrophicus methaneseepsis]|uniref:LysR family transcriptional regulator n=1 Tax=Phototrophicus methaneseepsis TaxID=2710758 RepID=A0A7S8IDC6_9CHLR|nr:LysR family transcriptional regulator [Phototrophicus methaneseepsis]QPC82440.1 LysR family transcriptional regulator [Phototrophicus methaneseepsis]
MNLQNLRTFYLAAKRGSFAAAAEELLYAPSTVTLHIQQLEAAWGVKLFEKHGRGVRLTNEGRTILGKVTTILDQVDTLDRTVQDMVEGEAGHIRIGAIEPVGSWSVAPLIAEYIRERPMLQINFETGSGYTMMDRIEAGELDVGLTYPPPPGTPMRFEPLFTEQMGLLMYHAHPLARKPRLRLDDLRRVRLIFTDTVSAYRGIVQNNLIAYGGTHPYANIEMTSIRGVVALVQRNIGVAMLPPMAADPLPEQTVLRYVEGHRFERTIGLLFRDYDDLRRRALDKFIVYLSYKLSDL